MDRGAQIQDPPTPTVINGKAPVDFDGSKF